MSVPTCAVSCYVYSDTGAAVAGAIVSATLNRIDVDAGDGYVFPKSVYGTTDANGLTVLNLWPNELGATESMYAIKISTPSGKKVTVNAVVPNTLTARLEEISEIPPYDGKTDGQLALTAAIAAGSIASAAATAASSSAASASSSATSAQSSQSGAAASATLAFGYKDAAASSATASAGSASLSAASAQASSGSATSAAGYAAQAASSAGAATSGGIRYDAAQTLTTVEKTQARSNIGLATVSATGSYNDLLNQPTIAVVGSSAQAYSPSLDSIVSLSGASGHLKKTGVSSWALDSTVETTANKGVANGYAPLGSDSKIASTYLPSYVDDVLEYANFAAFPSLGEAGKIYTALDTNKIYRWSGSVYVVIAASPGSTDSVPEGTANLYFSQARARASISVSGDATYNQSTGALVVTSAVASVAGKTGAVTLAPSDVGLSLVENKSSATVRSELTSGNVTTALGFTPYNATNPSGFIDGSGSTTGNSGTATSIAGGTVGQVPYQSGSGVTAFVANGTAGQVYTSNGDSAPSWQSPSGGFASGTRMLFAQTSAPTGWTKDTTNNDAALRVVSGTAGVGGSVAFTSAFASQNVGATALSSAQMPSHNHGVNDPSHSHSGGDYGHSHYYERPTGGGGSALAGGGDLNNGNTGQTTGNGNANIYINGNYTGISIQSSGSGATHTHTLNLAVKYVDVIVASKD